MAMQIIMLKILKKNWKGISVGARPVLRRLTPIKCGSVFTHWKNISVSLCTSPSLF